jgi:predicted nucleotidyltransferase
VAKKRKVDISRPDPYGVVTPMVLLHYQLWRLVRMKLNQIAKTGGKEYCAIVQQVTFVLKHHSGIAAAYLLGSVTTGQLRDDSDIDIALLPADGHVLSVQSRLELAGLLETKLGRKIDIGIIKSSNLIYASEAILKGQRIVTIQRDYTETTEVRLLGCYLVFKEDRKQVEERYRAA